jgi:uncharacterized protein YggE
VNRTRLAVLALALVGAAAIFAVAQLETAQSQSSPPNEITVTGMGSVLAVPDRADYSFGVETTAKTASQALAGNAAAMRRVIAALRAAGVAEADIQTQQVSIAPRYNQNGQKIIGYSAQNSVTAKVRTIDRVATVIEGAVRAGANQVYGPALLRSDRADFYRRALRSAIEDARSKGQSLAEATGLTLGRIVAVAEIGPTSSSAPLPGSGLAQGSSPPIEPGTSEIQASVSGTFAVG